MAKSKPMLIKLNSTADTGFFYVTKKNPRKTTEKLELKKYDPSRASTWSSRKARSSNEKAGGLSGRLPREEPGAAVGSPVFSFQEPAVSTRLRPDSFAR